MAWCYCSESRSWRNSPGTVFLFMDISYRLILKCAYNKFFGCHLFRFVLTVTPSMLTQVFSLVAQMELRCWGMACAIHSIKHCTTITHGSCVKEDHLTGM